jgi:hypothetical protein
MKKIKTGYCEAESNFIEMLDEDEKQMEAKRRAKGNALEDCYKRGILKAQIELLDEIYQACFQEDCRTIELVEDKLLELRKEWRKTIS